MKYDYVIKNRPDSSLLIVNLNDQEIKVEPGAMVYMKGNINMETKTGGIFGALKRAVVGESVFMNTFKGTGTLAIAPGYNGDIIPIDLNETGEVYLQKGAYLASSPDVNIEVKTSFRGLLGGLGLFLMKISGSVYEISGTGKVYVQTRSLESFIDTIAPFLPKR